MAFIKYLLYPAEAKAAGDFLRKLKEISAGLSDKEEVRMQKELAAIEGKNIALAQRAKEGARSLMNGKTLNENAQVVVRAMTERKKLSPPDASSMGRSEVPPTKETQSSGVAIIPGPIQTVKMAFCGSELLKESVVLLKEHFGLTPEEYFNRIYPFFRNMEAKPTAAREAAQRMTREGYFFEFLMPVSEKIRTAEDAVLADAIVAVLGGGKSPGETAGLAKLIATMENDIWRRLEFYPAAPDVWATTLTVVRDEGGKLVTDRLRGVLDLKKTEFTVAVIGESKLGLGYRQIVKQLIADIPRLMEGGSSDVLSVDKLKIKFNRKLLLIAQTEKPIPENHQSDVERMVREMTGMADINVELKPVENAEGAAAARKIIKATYDVIKELSKAK